ncbi:MAG: class I SAM-dependent methyltransferase [Minicystis sp.]
MRKIEADWTPERIGQFWSYYASRKDLRGTYFSLQMGAGMTRFLGHAGLLQGDVLDYGCGLGFLCAELVKRNVDVWGCDGSQGAVDAAKQLLQGNPRWHGASLSTDVEASFRNREFDLVTCIETVEHLSSEGRATVLGDIRARLRPGGSLFVTTPNDEHLEQAMHYCPFCDAEFHAMQHLTSFDKASLTRVLEEAGFEVVFAGAVNFGEIQAPLLPNLLDLSPRAVLRSARNLAFESYDRLSKRRFPSRFASKADSAKFPHLCAVAVKRERG